MVIGPDSIKNHKMYIYNVTINIEEGVHDQWMQWMQEIHIPDMLATGKFSQARMLHVLVEEEMGGILILFNTLQIVSRHWMPIMQKMQIDYEGRL